MPAVEECVSVSQTGLSRERWSAEGEAVPGRAQAEGDPTQCVFSSGMHSPVGDEHGAAETWAGSSWIPPGAKLGTEGEGHWRRPFSICSRCPSRRQEQPLIVLMGQWEGRPQVGLEGARKGC